MSKENVEKFCKALEKNKNLVNKLNKWAEALTKKFRNVKIKKSH